MVEDVGGRGAMQRLEWMLLRWAVRIRMCGERVSGHGLSGRLIPLYPLSGLQIYGLNYRT